MKNYLSADFHRIMTKKNHIWMMVFLMIADVAYITAGIFSKHNVIEMTYRVGGLDIIYSYVIILVNILISFRDDIRAKSIQTAVGNGIKRHEIVFAKWINLVGMAAIDITILTIVEFIPLIVTGKLAGSFLIWQIILDQITNVCSIALFLALAMIIIFQTQKAILGVLAYVYLLLSCTGSILELAVTNKIVQKFQLWNIGAGAQLNSFISKLSIGMFDIKNFLMVVLYFVIGFGLTIYFFKKKEMDL